MEALVALALDRDALRALARGQVDAEVAATAAELYVVVALATQEPEAEPL